jgi:hypothetical protein
MASRFRILHTDIGIGVGKIIYVVLTVCVLPSYLQRSSSLYSTQTTFHRKNTVIHESVPTDWWVEKYPLTSIQPANMRSVPYDAKKMEKHILFFTGKDEVPWQEGMVRIGRAW